MGVRLVSFSMVLSIFPDKRACLSIAWENIDCNFICSGCMVCVTLRVLA